MWCLVMLVCLYASFSKGIVELLIRDLLNSLGDGTSIFISPLSFNRRR